MVGLKRKKKPITYAKISPKMVNPRDIVRELRRRWTPILPANLSREIRWEAFQRRDFSWKSQVISLVFAMVPVKSSAVSEENYQILLLDLILWEKKKSRQRDGTTSCVNDIIEILSNTFPCISG